MENIAAYLLCVENGLEPSKDMMTKIIKAANSNFEQESLEHFLTKIAGKSHSEILEAGASKMASQAPVAAASSGASAGAAAAEEEKESEESEVMDMF